MLRAPGRRTGADDYLAKPFELPEMLARVEAMLRRRRADVFPGHEGYSALGVVEGTDLPPYDGSPLHATGQKTP